MADQILVAKNHFYFWFSNFPATRKNLRLLENVSSLVHFDHFSSKAWFFGTIYLNLHKDSSKNASLCLKCQIQGRPKVGLQL